jgi:hypothetical protein
MPTCLCHTVLFVGCALTFMLFLCWVVGRIEVWAMSLPSKPDCGDLHMQPAKWKYRTVDGVRRYTCPVCGKFMGMGPPVEKDLLKGKR